MKYRTYEIKDEQGAVIETGVLGWWTHTMVLADLAPHPTLGISGTVSAKGGWCKVNQWAKPETPVLLQCSAARWAEMLAEEINKFPAVDSIAVIDGIARVLDRLEEERVLARTSPAPEPIPEDPEQEEPVQEDPVDPGNP